MNSFAGAQQLMHLMGYAIFVALQNPAIIRREQPRMQILGREMGCPDSPAREYNLPEKCSPSCFFSAPRDCSANKSLEIVWESTKQKKKGKKKKIS